MKYTNVHIFNYLFTTMFTMLVTYVCLLKGNIYKYIRYYNMCTTNPPRLTKEFPLLLIEYVYV